MANNIVAEKADAFQVETSRTAKGRSLKLSLSQAISLGGFMLTLVTGAITLASGMYQTNERLTSLEKETREVHVMVVQNRLLTLEIAKELASKIDKVAGNEQSGLTGVDFAIKQTQAELDRLK